MSFDLHQMAEGKWALRRQVSTRRIAENHRMLNALPESALRSAFHSLSASIGERGTLRYRSAAFARCSINPNRAATVTGRIEFEDTN